jgi:ABC-type transport system involved in cytochrome bd biosynthesis fused ATPase/permease subunit
MSTDINRYSNNTASALQAKTEAYESGKDNALVEEGIETETHLKKPKKKKQKITTHKTKN